MEKARFVENVPVVGKYDVLIAGGGAAGVAAGISAARRGAAVCIVEQSAMLGGLGTSGLMSALMVPSTFCGIGAEILDILKKQNGCIYRPTETAYFLIPYQAEAIKRIYDNLIEQNNIKLYLCTKLTNIKKTGKTISHALLAGPEGNFSLKADMFIDATGNAGLSRYAGAKTVVGDEFGNTQAPTMVAYYANVDLAKRNAFFSLHGGDDVNVIHKFIPQAVKDGVLSVADYHHPGAFFVSDNMTVVNAGHVYGAECHTAEGLTKATVEGRKMALEYFNFYKKYIGGFSEAVMVTTGSWLGIRETERIIGRYVLNYDDQVNYRKFDDAVCRFPGGSGSDIHASSADGEAYKKYYELYTERSDYLHNDWFDFPYLSLLPKNIDNLLAGGRCASLDRRVNGQLRVMGTCFMMGEAAGAAAALCVKTNVKTDKLDIKLLQKSLNGSGLLCGYTKERK